MLSCSCVIKADDDRSVIDFPEYRSRLAQNITWAQEKNPSMFTKKNIDDRANLFHTEYDPFQDMKIQSFLRSMACASYGNKNCLLFANTL